MDPPADKQVGTVPFKESPQGGGEEHGPRLPPITDQTQREVESQGLRKLLGQRQEEQYVFPGLAFSYGSCLAAARALEAAAG